MTEFKTVWLNAGSKDPETNAPLAEAFVPMDESGTDESKRVPVGTVPLMPCLGIVAMPAAPDTNGHAEAIIAENVGGLPAVCVGGWDTRSHKMCANIKPGDLIVHSVGESQSAQLQLKDGTRQAVLATKSKKTGKQMLVVLDGEDGVIQVLANGGAFQIDADGNIAMSSPNGQNGISVTNDNVWIRGSVLLGGQKADPIWKVMLGPATGSPGGAASVPMIAAPGVNIGMS